jgi:hypothetical protein
MKGFEAGEVNETMVYVRGDVEDGADLSAFCIETGNAARQGLDVEYYSSS